MAVPHGRSRPVDVACALYRVLTRLYPSAFRREFGCELLVTFRNQATDVCAGGARACVAFAVHVIWDTIRTSATLRMPRRELAPGSILGLMDGAMADGAMSDSTMSVDFVFAVAGVVLGAAGWYAYFAVLPSYFH
ncbi:MAG: hypothetical protein IT184_05745 [Acidobacteria bacterium]|nr:hypothetical protein [Acidobacteriota bacterium]